jgi:NitT/TauT family transport system permease protein
VTAAPVPVASIPRGGAGAMLGRRVRDWVPAVFVLVAFIGLWEGIVKAAHVQRFLLPAPTAIWTAFINNQGQLWHEGWVTFQEAIGGFAIGCVAGILVAVVVARWDLVGSALMPYAIAANAIPIIAFAPITNAWFNPLTKTSHMVIASVLCFFPVFVNVVRGLRSVAPPQIELMRSYAVGEFTVFRLVRVPTALPFLFTALRVASVLAMIGAIVSEYYGGALDTLGANIEQDASLFQFERAWSEIVIACILGIGLYLAVALLERLATRWQPRVEMVGV